MEDERILELFRQRDESAIAETQRKYGALCASIARRLLGSREDTEECVSELLFRVWELIPPESPQNLKAWLAKLTRNIAVKRWNRDHAKKRYSAAARRLEELEDAVPSLQNVERELEDREVGARIEAWLDTLEHEERKLFVRRYWLGVPQKELARELGISPNTLAQRMYRLRQSLKTYLEQEDAFYG